MSLPARSPLDPDRHRDLWRLSRFGWHVSGSRPGFLRGLWSRPVAPASFSFQPGGVEGFLQLVEFLALLVKLVPVGLSLFGRSVFG